MPSAPRTIRSRLAEVGALDWISRTRFKRSIRGEIARYEKRVVTHRYAGRELTLSLEDPVAEEWYDHDWPVTPELQHLGRSRLTRGARVFDVGAHQGVVALILADMVGPDGEVVALEAEQHNFEVATRNRELNGADNLTVLHAAGGARDGMLNFSGGFNGTVVSGGGARTRAFSVDSLAERHGRPDVVFIDVEGFEHEVLSGAEHTIGAGATDFFVEVHVGRGLEELGGTAQQVLGFFDPDRFELALSPARGELESYEFVAAAEHADLLADRFFLIASARPS